ncbi:hypothetical protein ZHAS_00007485 [Anopheles sinensis]|uniref:Uncharacterized protein n=1 Tax=Anopheles sinensis TaxID=74873 RepID=A0A084VPW6_ANOSI|nr:hypothetical protein ZHAS_00007485 [Anopheles sinensis]
MHFPRIPPPVRGNQSAINLLDQARHRISIRQISYILLAAAGKVETETSRDTRNISQYITASEFGFVFLAEAEPVDWKLSKAMVQTKFN